MTAASPSAGFYTGIAEAEYAEIDAVRSSHLKCETAAHYRAALTAESKETPALKLGTAIHVAVLQWPEFQKRYGVAPVLDKRTVGGRAMWAEFNATGLIPMSEDEWGACWGIREALWSHPTISKLLNAVNEVEQTGVWQDEVTGVWCKLRSDAVCYNILGGVALDLKSTKCAAYDSFSYDSWKYKYHVSAAHYLDGYRTLGKPLKKFHIIAVEKVPPYAAAVYEMERDLLEIGAAERLCALQRIRAAQLSGEFQGYPTEVQSLKAKDWQWFKFKKEMES